MGDINRLKILLFEKKKMSKLQSEQLGITPSTVSKWYNNASKLDTESQYSEIGKRLSGLCLTREPECCEHVLKFFYTQVYKKTPTAVAGVELRLKSLVVKSLSLVSGCKNSKK